MTPRRSSPLTPPGRLKEGTRERSRFPSLISFPRAARQCCPPPRDRGAFRRESPCRAPSRAPAWSSTPAGRRARLLHVFIDVRKLRLDPSTHRFRGRFPGRVRSHDFCRSMFQRALPWTTRTSRTSGIRGRDGCLIRSIVAFRSRTTAGGTQGQGPRITEPSALPPGIAPARDFAPTPIASDTSCRGHCPSPSPELTRETDEAAGAGHASKA